jgi:hypothetical protein
MPAQTLMQSKIQRQAIGGLLVAVQTKSRKMERDKGFRRQA